MSRPEKMCGTCRHWGEDVTDDYTREWFEDDTNDYRSEPAPFPLRKCEAVIHHHRMEDGGRNTRKAHVVDGSSYYAALHTANDFGCAMWEAKE